jgi:predicted ester cyclase
VADDARIARHKAVVQRLFDDVWNGRRFEAIAELYDEEYVSDYRPYALRRGHAGLRRAVENAWAAFPDFHEELLDLVAEGDRVVVHLRGSGTHTRPWGPIAPTGKALAWEEILILTFRDGRVVHQRGIVDNVHILRQLGILPTLPLAE